MINRVTNPDLNKFITIPGVEILSYIESDDYHAANDIQGKTVYDASAGVEQCTAESKEVLEKIPAFSERRAIKLINKGQTTRERNQKGV